MASPCLSCLSIHQRTAWACARMHFSCLTMSTCCRPPCPLINTLRVHARMSVFSQASQARESEALDISAVQAAQAGEPRGAGTYRVTERGLDSVVRACAAGWCGAGELACLVVFGVAWAALGQRSARI